MRRAIALIERMPLIWPRTWKKLRKASVLGFPFVLIYRLRQTEVEIIAVAHVRRRPGYWKDRVH